MSVLQEGHLEGLTVKELDEFIVSQGLDVNKKLKKVDKIAAIKAAMPVADDGGASARGLANEAQMLIRRVVHHPVHREKLCSMIDEIVGPVA